MYNILVKEVKAQKWCSPLSVEIIKKFNKSGHHLTLQLFEEPESMSDLDCMLEEGMYNFVYPDCPEAKELEKLIKAGEECARFLYFERDDLIL